MSHRLRVVLDGSNTQTDVIWDILKNLRPSKSKAQTDLMKYLASDENSKTTFENSHDPVLEMPAACTWLNDQLKPCVVKTPEEAKQFKYFGEVSFGSFFLGRVVK